jgi:hypothetical protein
MSEFAPKRVEDALKFCCCSPYQNRQICIYVGGGSSTQHDMYWAYAIYDEAGDRINYEYLPENCLDVDDGLRFCEQLIDKWDAPITYEDVRLWRDICEYLNQRKSPTGSHYIKLQIPGCDYLVGYDRTHRQKLWDKYKIQLITYEKFSKKYEGWRLKGNWEDKIDFLEQIYVLGRDAESLPRPWLDKWEKKQQAKKAEDEKKLKARQFENLIKSLEFVEHTLNNLHYCDTEAKADKGDYFSSDAVRGMVQGFLRNTIHWCKEARLLLPAILKNEKL